MRRALWLLPAAGVAALASTLVLWRPSTAGAEKAAPAPDPKAARSGSLPVSRVILYSSGVGYFQRAGKVTGSARVDLSFPVGDINDLLKSLVLQDLGGAWSAPSPTTATTRSRRRCSPSPSTSTPTPPWPTFSTRPAVRRSRSSFSRPRRSRPT